MPAPQNTYVREYFQWKKAENVHICIISLSNTDTGIKLDVEELCGAEIKGNKVSNLRAHMQRKHPATYKKLLEREKPSEATLKQKPITKYLDSFMVSSLSRMNVVKGLLHLVTVNGRPFQAVEDEGLQIAFGPVLERLNRKYNRQNIATLVNAAAEYIVEKLKKLLVSTLVSVCVDCVSRFSRSFIGINVQLGVHGQIEVFTLGTEEIKKKHTGANLKNIILACLARYGIHASNIYTITSDNGSNILKASKLLDSDYQALKYSGIPEVDPDDEHEMNALVEIICGDDWADDNIQTINCLAHSLQLAIMDAVKNAWEEDIAEESYIKHIKSARELAKKLRSQNNLLLLTSKNKSRPNLDVKTRWGSTYKMVDDVLNVREICHEAVQHGNQDLYLPPSVWDALEEIRTSLQPSYNATIQLQSKNLTLTDARRVVEVCWIRTAEIGTPLSQELLYRFEQRRSQLTSNSAMRMAIFLDPRHLFELSKDECEDAKKRLIALFKRLMDLKKAGKGTVVENKCEQDMDLKPESDDHSMFGDGGNEDIDPDDALLYEIELQKKAEAKSHEENIQSSTVSSFKQELNAYEETYAAPQHRANSSMQVLSFWESKKSIFPLLYEVAIIVLAAPGTQVSVERLFSQLKLILSDLRERLGSHNAENVLLVRSNFEQLDDAFFAQVALH